MSSDLMIVEDVFIQEARKSFSQRGMTSVELLIASVMGLIVLGIGGSILLQSHRSEVRASAATSLMQDHQIALGLTRSSEFVRSRMPQAELPAIESCFRGVQPAGGCKQFAREYAYNPSRKQIERKNDDGEFFKDDPYQDEKLLEGLLPGAEVSKKSGSGDDGKGSGKNQKAGGRDQGGGGQQPRGGGGQGEEAGGNDYIGGARPGGGGQQPVGGGGQRPGGGANPLPSTIGQASISITLVCDEDRCTQVLAKVDSASNNAGLGLSPLNSLARLPGSIFAVESSVDYGCMAGNGVAVFGVDPVTRKATCQSIMIPSSCDGRRPLKAASEQAIAAVPPSLGPQVGGRETSEKKGGGQDGSDSGGGPDIPIPPIIGGSVMCHNPRSISCGTQAGISSYSMLGSGESSRCRL